MDMLDISNNNSNKISELFAEYLEDLKQVSTTTYNSNYYVNRFTVYFYEWSDISNRPRQFGSREVFMKYLEDCNIILTDYQRSRLEKGYWFYGSCKPGKNELLLCDTYMTLRDLLLSYS